MPVHPILYNVQKPVFMVGIMSGTSVDGVHAALIEIDGEAQQLRWKLLGWYYLPWEPELKSEILAACRPDTPLQKVVLLNYRIAEVFAEAAKKVIAQCGLKTEQIDAIASHGQTIWHQAEPMPLAGRLTRGTLQIGEPAVIAASTGCVVIADFRAADIAVGGQGAPLVPVADRLLFGSDKETRVVQNIGGIANATYLPQGCQAREDAEIIAFDTGPGNMVMDEIVREMTAGLQEYDREGQWAAQGRIQEDLLAECLAHPYFQQPPPKSTGREQFGKAYVQWFCQRARELGLRWEDMLATASALTVESIAQAYERWLLPKAPIHRVIVGGGGVHNRWLMQQLQRRLAPMTLSTHEEFGVPDDAKEAIAFALLGYLTLRGMPGNLPSATGATRPVVLGKIVFP
ncbi:molecular chaperone [Chthonomonas calidirosea]|uniref:anhydro-N-acetylmuramic acid kinase n=1 Tax=Chthonomonas calidirosea TaxID=454171 RepID=UPI0006DD504C|nr:anhydro-N-acetylmuramic acid kinase [Chthonomonas calidirosea]CEK15688.1 molecular chaperone [Chthonomonas calidirosea]